MWRMQASSKSPSCLLAAIPGLFGYIVYRSWCLRARRVCQESSATAQRAERWHQNRLLRQQGWQGLRRGGGWGGGSVRERGVAAGRGGGCARAVGRLAHRSCRQHCQGAQASGSRLRVAWADAGCGPTT